jgi:putative nucleotidyltransferase with HDIG domain
MAARRNRWKARPFAAALLRLFIIVVPAVAGALAAWETGRVLPEPSGFWPTVAWFAALVAVAVAVVLVVQRAALRLLPLAWLFTLTLAFPDRAPSRLATARRAASRRQQHKALDRLAENGLGRDAAEAADAALVLVAALGAHDRRTRGHSERVRTLADLLAEEAGVADDDRDRLRWAALLHDIGKLAVPGAILNKPDRPDAEEWATLRRHPEEGAHLVEPLVTWLGPWAGAVAHHHEKWDGTGYPQGLSGEDISLGGRILAIADAYEVMTAARAYKKPLSAATAREELVASSGSHFDPNLVRAFMGVSLGALWWAAGASAALAQVPLLARVSGAPGFARIRAGLAGSATAVATVTALVVAGAVGGGNTSSKTAVARTQVAAPATPPATAPVLPTAPAPEPALEAAAAPAISPGLVVPTRAVPSIDEVLKGVAPTTTPAPTGPPPPTSPAPGPAPADVPPPSSPAPAPYTAQGQLLAPDLLGRLGLGLTDPGPPGGCGPSASQGLDAWVFQLPDDAPGAGAPVKATGSDLLGLHNLAVTFLSQSCAVVGQLDTEAADEAGVLPPGTRFVIVSDRSGVGTTVALTVG